MAITQKASHTASIFALRDGFIEMEPDYLYDRGYVPLCEDSALLDHSVGPHSAHHTPKYEDGVYKFYHYSLAPPPPQPSEGFSQSDASHMWRKYLTDEQRRDICRYARDNPQAERKEIAGVFGFERSTISKVLSKKDKYLTPQEEVKSVPEKPTAELPDIGRALCNWLRISGNDGSNVIDDVIREKAFELAASSGLEIEKVVSHINSSSWLEELKQPHLAASPRSQVHAFDDRPTSAEAREFATCASHESLQMATGSDLDCRPENSNSSPALSGACSEGPLSGHPTYAIEEPSSLWGPDLSASMTAHQYLTNSYHTQPGMAKPDNGSSFRRRSRTTPALSSTNHKSPRRSIYSQTPKLMVGLSSIHKSPNTPSRVQYHATTCSSAMPPPSLSASIPYSPVFSPPSLNLADSSLISASTSVVDLPYISPTTSHSQFGLSSIPDVAQFSSLPTQDDARAALLLLIKFIQTQPSSIANAQNYLLINEMLQQLSLPLQQVLPENYLLQSQPHVTMHQGHGMHNATQNQRVPSTQALHLQPQPRTHAHGHLHF